MNLLAIDRSTDVQSVAVAKDGAVTGRVFEDLDARSPDWPVRIRAFLAENGLSVANLDVILVGQGPGSFAGIRAALAFAQGLALPSGKTVAGLPSTYAFTRPGVRTAVIGDARRGRFWVVLYDGETCTRPFALVGAAELADIVPADCVVTTPDGARIGASLQALFGVRYVGSSAPTAARLAEIALAHPSLPQPEPLPLYLQPAVRPPEP